MNLFSFFMMAFLLSQLISCGSNTSSDSIVSGAEESNKGKSISMDVKRGGKTHIESCRFYVALDGSNAKKTKAELRSYNRKPSAFIGRTSPKDFADQMKENDVTNFEYQKNEWKLTNDHSLDNENKPGFSKVQFYQDKQLLADVTGAVQTEIKSNQKSYLLNLGVRVWSGEDMKEVKETIAFDWGVQSVDVSNVPFYFPADYNLINNVFPMTLPRVQKEANYTGKNEFAQILPDLNTREEATSHGLRFGDIYPRKTFGPLGTIISLKLLRSCVIEK